MNLETTLPNHEGAPAIPGAAPHVVRDLPPAEEQRNPRKPATREQCRLSLLCRMKAETRHRALSRTDGHWPFLPPIPTPMPRQQLEIAAPWRRFAEAGSRIAPAPAILGVVALVAMIVA